MSNFKELNEKTMELIERLDPMKASNLEKRFAKNFVDMGDGTFKRKPIPPYVSKEEESPINP